MVLEVIAMCVEDAIETLQRRGMPQPETLVLVGDNTVKELKNSTCLLHLANLVNHHKLRRLRFDVLLFL